MMLAKFSPFLFPQYSINSTEQSRPIAQIGNIAQMGKAIPN